MVFVEWYAPILWRKSRMVFRNNWLVLALAETVLVSGSNYLSNYIDEFFSNSNSIRKGSSSHPMIDKHKFFDFFDMLFIGRGWWSSGRLFALNIELFTPFVKISFRQVTVPEGFLYHCERFCIQSISFRSNLMKLFTDLAKIQFTERVMLANIAIDLSTGT